MSSDLASRHCEACAPGTLPISTERAQQLHSEIDVVWELRETEIVREFRLRNFRDAFGFATKVAMLSEQEGHHPDLEVGWGYVNVTLTTHAAKGLTDNDFIMAAKIDKIAEREPLKD